MKLTAKALLTAALVMTAGSFCFGADQIDNPEYQSWAKFKPGTTVTLKIESDMANIKSEQEKTMTLVDITPDKAVVETKASLMTNGVKTDLPASKRDVLAKLDKPPEVKMPANTPKPEVKESTEEVDAAGTKVEAKVTEAKQTSNGITEDTKTWTSDKVPGGMVKLEATMDGTMKGTTKITLTSMTVK